MMAESRIISSDGHIIEPPGLWTTTLESKFREQAPRVVREEDGDWWYCEGRRVGGFSGSQLGWRFEGKVIGHTDRFENVRPGAYLPAERIKDMDLEGVHGGVLYPTLGLLLFGLRHSELLAALCRTYNNWIAEFCGAYPERLKGIAMINLDNIQEGIGELERARDLGLAGALISVYPMGRPYSESEYQAFWSAAEELDLPLSLHIATIRPTPGEDFSEREQSTAFRANRDYWVRMSLAHMIYAGVFERHPKLKVGTVEHELGWIPHFLDRLDYTYTQRNRRADWIPFKNNMLPSDFFHQNVFCNFLEDALGVKERYVIGVDNIAWGWHYPHAKSTFPKSREILDRMLADVPEEEKRKIVGDNAARLYQFTAAIGP